MSDLIPIIIAIVALLLLALGAAAIIARFYRKVLQGQALIVNTMKSEPLVTFTGAVVFPIIHRAEVMDISVKTIEIDRRGKEGLICQDNIRADINVTFFVRVNKTRDDVLKVAQSIGCVRASDHETLRELFSAKFSEALKTVKALRVRRFVYQARRIQGSDHSCHWHGSQWVCVGRLCHRLSRANACGSAGQRQHHGCGRHSENHGANYRKEHSNQ